MAEVYEGVLEELIAKHDLAGRRVRIEVVELPKQPADWYQKALAWMEEFKVEGIVADDSRDSIYTGTRDDPR